MTTVLGKPSHQLQRVQEDNANEDQLSRESLFEGWLDNSVTQ